MSDNGESNSFEAEVLSSTTMTVATPTPASLKRAHEVRLPPSQTRRQFLLSVHTVQILARFSATSWGTVRSGVVMDHEGQDMK